MKKNYSFLIFLWGFVLLLGINTSNSQALVNSPFGWATSGGSVTGGGNATPQTVSSNSAFRSAVSGSGSKVVYVSGTIDLGIATTANIGSNTTIIGQGSNATLLHGGIRLSGVSNVIIRNINFKDARDPDWECETPTEGGQPSNCTSSNANYDLITIQSGSSRIWIDHCSFENHQTNELAYDGQLDIRQASDYITISYCVFKKSRKTNLIGSSNSETGNYRITWAYNWWDGTSSRNPMIRFGRVHVLNNYYSNVSSYCIGVRINSRIYAERNYFLNSDRPSTQGDASGQIQNVSNTFVNCSPNSFDGQVSSVGWTPSYSYTALSASQVPAHVQANAGAGNMSSGCSPTSIEPYIQVDGGSWQQTSSVTIASGATVKLGPQPNQGGSWSWSGCGTSGSSREQTINPTSTCSPTATYTNACGEQSSQTFNITVSGNNGSTNTVTIQENTTGFCSVDGSVDSNNTGYTGSGFSNTDNASGEGIEWSINGDAGTYVFRWNYANESATNRSGLLYINGSAVSNEDFISTENWEMWTTTSVTLSNIPSGIKNIRLEANQPEGLANIDYLEVTGPNVTTAGCSNSRLGNGEVSNKELVNLKRIRTYPNPADQILNIHLENTSTGKILFYDISGKLIREEHVSTSDSQLNIGDLESGIYYMEVRTDLETIRSRLIKK